MNLKNIYTNPTSIAWGGGGGFTGRIDLAFGTKNNVLEVLTANYNCK